MSDGVEEAALVLFSGGQDSTACLGWALERWGRVETVGFDYGQRHAVELACREPIRAALAQRWPGFGTPRLGEDHLLDMKAAFAGLGATAMTSEAEIGMGAAGLPTTFVPGRNLLFLTMAAALAYRRGIRHIVGGMCETDFSGYPDCRDDTVKAMQLALNLGMDRRFVLHTPLMWIDKAQTWAMAAGLGLLEVTVELTHTCYRGDRTHRHAWGYGCGDCPACDLRAQGYARFEAAA
ncbi:MAG: 7-cyano-7-deazaguanine synthase QueC [Janthinobacterium lividum]